MADENKGKVYRLRVPGAWVEVTEEVYRAYYRFKDELENLERVDKNNGKVSYNALDTDEMVGEEMIPDLTSESVEDLAVIRVLVDKLHHCLALLPEPEHKLIHAIYFENLTERQLSDQMGLHHMTIHNRKVKILYKLQKLMEK